MSNSPFDPNNPLSPWYRPPVPPQPERKPIADWSAFIQPKPPTPPLEDLIIRALAKPPAYVPIEIQPQPKPFDLGNSFAALPLKFTRPRVFVSYQHSSDQYYYNLFSRAFHDAYELIFDGSLREEIDSDDHDYIKQRIRDEFITGTSCTIVLVGPTTYQRKHVDWEIKATLDKEHGLIGLQLPNLAPDFNGHVRVPDRLHANINSGYAVWQGLSWQQLIANPALLKHHVTDACARPKDRIVNSHEIKKRNG